LTTVIQELLIGLYQLLMIDSLAADISYVSSCT